MIKKHFIEIANILRVNKASDDIIISFVTFLSKESPKFDSEKFIKTCKGMKNS